MKKKILPCSAFFYVAIALIVTFVFGCKREETSAKDEKSNDHLVVTATFYPMYIMLLNITENIPDIELKLLAPAETGCLHDYQLSTADMKTIMSQITSHLNRRIRCIIWKQWKKTKTRYEALKQLGVEDKIAFNCANTRKGYYNICQSTYVMFAINNERLKRKGLITLLDQYEKVHIEYTN